MRARQDPFLRTLGRALLVGGVLLSPAGCGDDDDGDGSGGGKGGSSRGGSAGTEGGGEGGEGEPGGTGGRGGTSGRGGTGGDAGAGTGGSGAEGGEGTDPCAACADQHRECDATTSECGDCFPDFRDVGGVCECPVGQIPEGDQCVACADDFTPNCVGAGETGQVVRKVDGVCICETMNGFFFNLESNAAQACDGDDDGWTNDGAQPAIDGNDQVLRENARCNLRRVGSIVLENEAGDEHTTDLLDDFPDGLPLYESARNDGVESATPHAPYGGEPLRNEVLNSLTKACVTPNGDYDDNGIPDLGEWTGRMLAGRATRNPRLQGYYQRYLRFTYYLELHDGWFEAAGGGSYRIRERQRIGAEVPVRYPTGADSYYRECERHVDKDYEGSPQSFAGADFVELGVGGMTHHSQFKCVQVMSESDYGTAYNRERNPEIVYKPVQTGFARRATRGTLHQCPADVPVTTPAVELYDWTPNTCSARATTTTRSGADTINPHFAQIDCQATDPVSIEPGVYWMAVGYENYSCERSDAVVETADDYTRGCISECAEQGVESCPGFDPGSSSGSTRFTCDDEGRTAFGRLQCGCGRSYGGAACEMGCPEARMTDNFSIETRAGYWLCGGTQASTKPVLSGGSLTLLGYVPGHSTGANVLSGGPYELRGR